MVRSAQSPDNGSTPTGSPVARKRAAALLEVPAVRRRAFTLIELLVVIAVIGLLVSVLLPSFKKAMELTRRTACTTNHKVLLAGIMFYNQEYRDIMPFVNSNRMETRSSSPACEQPGWLYQYHADDKKKEQITVTEGLIYPYVGNEQAYRCPGDYAPYVRGPIHEITSYQMNRCVVGGKDMFPAYRSYEYRSDAFLFWEVDESRGGGWWNDGTNMPAEGITRRHGDGATISCFGGSAVPISLEEYERELDIRPGRLFCTPDEPDGY